MRRKLTPLADGAILMAAAALALAAPALADEQGPATSTTPATTTSTSTVTTPAPAPAPAPSETTATGTAPSGVGTSTSTTPTTTASPSTPAASPEASAVAPRVRRRHEQRTSSTARKKSRHEKRAGKPKGGRKGHHGHHSPGEAALRKGKRAPSPSSFTPPSPFGLNSLTGVPGFFVESFQIPPFLLPIYQAAGSAYDVPWQVLAAINEVETDYGRDLSVSSAGAEGWMQFLPSSWAQYGVDANGDGFKDPYNPADAIFTAARYLHAAGAASSIRAAVFAYNHSQAYVSTVMLRAQLLAGTPPELLGAITGLTQSRFPVHAPSHYGDGFATVRVASEQLQTLPGTTVYSQPGAPVIAVQDGEVVGMGDSPTLGQYVSLRDGYGNLYTYAQLGSVASVYPVLQPRAHAGGRAHTGKVLPAGAEAPPTGPATAGAQPRSPLSMGAVVSGMAFGAAASLESVPPLPVAPPRRTHTHTAPAHVRAGHVSSFTSGQDEVYLHPLQIGVQVIAGTVLGHLGNAASGASEVSAPGAAGVAIGEAHMLFQIRPAGSGAPLIDPKPIMDGWVALENTSTFRARGADPFLASAPTVGQVLLESKGQLQTQVAHESHIHMLGCERAKLQTGKVDRRVLATLELLAVSGLDPSVAGLGCGNGSPASEGNPSASAVERIRIVAINGVPVAGHQGAGSLADATVRKLLTLQGADRPLRIASLMRYPHSHVAVVKPSANDYVSVSFGPSSAVSAHAASTSSSPLTPREWTRLVARLGEIPDPTVAGAPSSAAIPDGGAKPSESGQEGGANGND